MINVLTCIGLILTPFIVIPGFDGRYPKELFACGIALAITFWMIYKGELKAFKNPAILITMLVIWFCSTQVPPSGMVMALPKDHNMFISTREDIDNLWNYKPILYALIYILLIVSIASYKDLKLKYIFRCIAYAGLGTAILIILQKLGFSQWMGTKPPNQIGWGVANPELYALIGNPTLAAAFLCLCIPATLYFDVERFFAVPIAVAILLTGSAFGVLGIFSALVLFICKGRRWLMMGSFIAIAIAGYLILFYFHVTDHGRIDVWKQALFDITHPIYKAGQGYGFTGYGAGAFHFAFPIIHNTGWMQAHNEFIEFLFNNGAFGLLALLTSIGFFMKDLWAQLKDDDVHVCFSIFVISLVLAQGTFIFQLAIGAFYISVIVGCAYNKIRRIENDGQMAISY